MIPENETAEARIRRWRREVLGQQEGAFGHRIPDATKWYVWNTEPGNLANKTDQELQDLLAEFDTLFAQRRIPDRIRDAADQLGIDRVEDGVRGDSVRRVEAEVGRHSNSNSEKIRCTPKYLLRLFCACYLPCRLNEGKSRGLQTLQRLIRLGRDPDPWRGVLLGQRILKLQANTHPPAPAEGAVHTSKLTEPMGMPGIAVRVGVEASVPKLEAIPARVPRVRDP